MIYSKVIGIGTYLPPRIVENADLEGEEQAGWIYQRTGVLKRHVAEESAFEMGVKALKMAINDANLRPDEVEYLFVTTNSPEMLIPGMAGRMQEVLGGHVGGLDLQAGCSGFVQAMEIADAMIRSGSFSKIAVVSTEKITSIVEKEDLNVSSLFGDGAAAIVMCASDEAGLLASYSRVQSEGWRTLFQPHGGYLRMDGKAVFRFAVNAIEEGIKEVLKKGKMSLEDVDLVIPHQSNMRIISRVSKEMGIPLEKFQISISEHANTASASVVLALKAALDARKVKRSSTVLMVTYGAGLALASNVLKL